MNVKINLISIKYNKFFIEILTDEERIYTSIYKLYHGLCYNYDIYGPFYRLNDKLRANIQINNWVQIIQQLIIENKLNL